MKRIYAIVSLLVAPLLHGQLLVDQQALPGTVAISQPLSVGTVAGQSFVPTFSTMNYWRFNSWFPIFEPRTISVTLSLHSGTDASSPALAQSGMFQIESTTEIQFPTLFYYYMPAIEWNLAEAVSLIPQTTYTVFMEAISGDSVLLAAYLDVYSNGNFIFNGESFAAQSLAFTQGQVIPEPSVVALLLIGLAILINKRYRTKRCTEWLPVARPMRTRCARLASVAPRAAIGDRGR